MFLLLAGVFFLVHICGILLLREPPAKTEGADLTQDLEKNATKSTSQNDEGYGEEVALLTQSERTPEVDAEKSDGRNLANQYELADMSWVEGCAQVKGPEMMICVKRERQDSVASMNETQGKHDDDSSSTDDTDDTPKKHWLIEILKRREFYVICVLTAAVEFSYVGQFTYYKTFGAIYIPDDHFLSLIGTFLAVSIVVSRILWGILLDKYSLKCSIMLAHVSLTILEGFFYFTPMVNKWFYLVWNQFVSGATIGMYAIGPMAIYKYFGTDHFIVIYGLTTASCALVNLPFPVVSRLIVDAFSWFGLFSCMAVAHVLSLVFALLALPRDNL